MLDRIGRVEEQIKREVAVILQRDIEDPRVEGVAITRVEVTRDLGMAKIFFMVEGDKKTKKLVEMALMSHVKFIRREMAHELSMKFTPRLSFRIDALEEYQATVDELFRRIEKEKEGKESQ